jgi:DNA-binding NarL/FixJ family response regulator
MNAALLQRDVMETIRVIIIDEQPLFREGIHTALNHMKDCVIVGESTNAENINELVRSSNPDVVLINADLTSADPLEIAQQALQIAPRTAVILLVSSEDEERLFQSIKVGVAGYYTRNITPEELEEAIHKVSQGQYLINNELPLFKPQSISRDLKPFRELITEEIVVEDERQDLSSPLSSREIEILDYIARGNSNKEIAKSLKISDQTVKNHITSILKKLAVNDRTAAVVYALRHGWIKMHQE